MVKRVMFAVPGDLDTPTGGYAYDKRIVSELRAMGWDVTVADLGSEFPRPSAVAKENARAMLMAGAPGVPIVIDGLAWGVLPEVAQELGATHRAIALVHHPLALETGLSAAESDKLCASERTALRHSKHVIVTSPATAEIVASEFGVPRAMISVARPGNDPVPPSHGSRDGLVNLLAVGSIVPRKGYDILVAALAQLKDLPWRLRIVGDPSRDVTCAAALAEDIEKFDLGTRIARAGVVTSEQLAAFYGEADLFVLPSRFEGYGMAFADAIAHGVPVIAADAGAVRGTVPPQAGILVAPDDVTALRDALREVIANPERRQQLQAGAREAARSLPTWRASAEIFARAIEAAA